MYRKTALILRETRHSETRVAATPWVAAMLKELGFRVWVESGAGTFSGWSDNDYCVEGAEIVDSMPTVYHESDLVIQVKRPKRSKEIEIIDNLRPGSIVLGFLDPQVRDRTHIMRYKSRQLTTFAWELLPKTKRTEAFDAVAAMSRVAGTVVVDHFLQSANVQNLEGKRVLVLGMGNAGAASAKQSLEYGAHVVGMGSSYPARLIPQGNRFNFTKLPKNNLWEQRKKIETVLFSPELSPDLVICSARRRYENAPLLITKGMIKRLRKRIILYDLAASSGGNCECSQYGSNVLVGNAEICSMTGYPKFKPQLSSVLYSDCVLRFITHLFKEGSLASECLKSCLTVDSQENLILTNSSQNSGFESRAAKWITEYFIIKGQE